MRLSSRDHDDPKSYSMKMVSRVSVMSLPSPPSKAYTLRVDVFNGQALPADSGLLHIVLGPYLIKTAKKDNKDGVVVWHETYENNRIVLPVDP